MAFTSSIFAKLWLIPFLSFLAPPKEYDFFYFVVEWPPSSCHTKSSCCYPTTGKPAQDFGIHGLWPNYVDGTFPKNCDNNNRYDESQISDLISRMQQSWPTLACPSANGTKFWKHEWKKHGTCSESNLDQHAYFEAALDLKDRLNYLLMLESEGIKPDGGEYSVASIRDVIREWSGYTPGITCIPDAFGNIQLNEISMCVDKSGRYLIDCPVFPTDNCASNVFFPPF